MDGGGAVNALDKLEQSARDSIEAQYGTLSAGYVLGLVAEARQERAPQVVTTMYQLTALPIGSLLRDSYGCVWETWMESGEPRPDFTPRHLGAHLITSDTTMGVHDQRIMDHRGPFQVIYTPEESHD